jgi:hypothetical protein
MAWNGFRSYTMCLKSFRGANTMNDVNTEKKRFKAFTHAAMNLSMSLLCFILLTGHRKIAHMSLNFIIPLKQLTGYRVLTGNYLVMEYLQAFILMCNEKTMIKQCDVLMSINNTSYGKKLRKYSETFHDTSFIIIHFPRLNRLFQVNFVKSM